MIEYPEFDYVVVKRPGSGVSDIRAPDMVSAFNLCDLWLRRWQTLEDLGDRVRITDSAPYCLTPQKRDFTFLLNGEVHVPGHEIIYLHNAYSRMMDELVMRRRQALRTGKRWSRHDLRFAAPSTGSERRANHGVATDEEMSSVGIRMRPKRLFGYSERLVKQSEKERCWKRFRRTRWKQGEG
nr:hypothetical protein [Neorhizobium tomejilense]